MKRQKVDPSQIAASQLLSQGYVVLQLHDVNVKIEDWDRVIKNMPEFAPHAQVYVGGGFAALGNPSSFHNVLVRRLRAQVLYSVREIFARLGAELGFDRLELLIDRMMQRMPSQSVGHESWHRDEAKSPNLEKGDVVLGGWLNVDDTPQSFRCCPGSHQIDHNQQGGFALISDKQTQYWEKKSKQISVPPKHLLVFFENIVHCVMPSSGRQRRLFMGWRLTNSTLSLIPDIEQRLATQSVIPLKSGQMPPLWPELYWTNHRETLIRLSANFIPALRQTTIIKSGKNAGDQVEHIVRFCPSLAELGLQLYPPYLQEELDYYKPFLI